jgi:hypothetical protein
VFDHFWDFDKLVKDESPRRSGDHEILLVLRAFWDFRVYVMGIKCQPMGFTHIEAFCKCINKELRNGRSTRIGLVQVIVRGFVHILCKRLCASKELALCLDLVLGRRI